MKRLITSAFICFGLLAHTVLSQKLEIENLSLFIADDFNPKAFKGQLAFAANEAIKTIFSLSKENLLNGAYSISPKTYGKIMDTIRQGSSFNASEIYKKVKGLKILPSDTDLKAFGNEKNSVVFYCGPKRHAMLCEIFKVKSSDSKHDYLWKVLIYNSGFGLQHHPRYKIGPKKKSSPVVIYEGPPLLLTPSWVDAALHFGHYKKVITNFYPRLLGDFYLSNATYDVFIDPQRTETCSFSSYHAYFTFKLGESRYKRIFAVASLSALQHFVSKEASDFISKRYLSKYSLCFSSSKVSNSTESHAGPEYFSHDALSSNSSVLNEIGKFHFLRWNVGLIDTMFRYLVEIGNCVFGNKENVFFKDLKVAYDEFQIAKRKNIFNAVPTHIADNRGRRASFSKATVWNFCLGSHDKLSSNEKFYCELPNFEYQDGAYDPANFTEFSNSILRFLSNEIAYQQCFMGKDAHLISYLDSLTFRMIPMLGSYTPSDVDKLDFLCTFFIKMVDLLQYDDSDAFMYQKTLILVEILKTYKEIYTRHVKTSLNNDEYKFKLINTLLLEKLSPYFVYSNGIDLLGRTLPSYGATFWLHPENGKISSELVATLFKNNSYPPSSHEMETFFNLDLINDRKTYPRYDPNHLKRIAYILTVIANPLSLENANQGVPPEICLLDRHYYNLLHMLCKLSRRTGGALVSTPIDALWFSCLIDTKHNFRVKADGYNNTREISSLSSKEKRPLKLMNLDHKFSSVFYFLNYLQEDHAFILSDAGMEILYTFILKASTYTDHDSKRALPLVIEYFLSRKDSILRQVSTHKGEIGRFKLLANYQLILNRLISIQKRNLDISDLEHVFLGEFQPIFAFLKLNTLILEARFFELPNSHKLYLSVISNFELINSFFFKEEIQYVLTIYYDHWKFPTAKSRCTAQKGKELQNLVNGNFLIDGERIQFSGLPFSNHRLWNIMDVKRKREYRLEFTLHKHRHDGSISYIFKYNDIDFILNEKDAFLLKNDEIEAKLVSEDFKLCHEKLDIHVKFNSKMIGSDRPIIALQTHAANQNDKVYLFDSDGFEFGEVCDGNTLGLKNSSTFIGNLSIPLPCYFLIGSFCSFSSKSQSLLDAFLTRGVLFNFALDSYIFALENEVQSFYFFNSYNGPAKHFYAMKEASEEYFAVIKGEKFKIHSPASIEGNFFASSNLPFLFVSIEKSFHIIIPVPLSPPGNSYNFTFVKATCKDDHFNIEGHDREIEFSIIYWLVFLRYYDRSMEYISLYTSVFFELTEIELVILRNILEIKYRDLEYLVIEAWTNNLFDEDRLFFHLFLNNADRVKMITDVANLIPVIPFKYKRLLCSFLPNITEDTHLWAYSNKLQIYSTIGESSTLKPNIPSLKKTIQKAQYKLSRDTFPKLKLTHWNRFKNFLFPSCISFLYDLAQSSKGLNAFLSRFNTRYLNFVRFYLEMDKTSDEYKFVSLFHVIFVVFNNSRDKKKLSTFLSKWKRNRFPYELFDIYESSTKFRSFSPYEKSINITAILPSPPADYENLLQINIKRKALSCSFLKANASFKFFSDTPSLEKKLNSIVATDELLSGFPLAALQDRRLLAQILLCGSIEELGTFFTISAKKTPELLDLLWSHFMTAFYCKSPRLKENTFCKAWIRQNMQPRARNIAARISDRIFGEQKVPSRRLNFTLQDKVFILIEVFTESPLYEEQRTIMSTILDKMMHGRSYVVQQGVAGGKTTRFGPVAAIVATSILRKLPIFIFPNSILNQNTVQLRQWLFDFFGKSVFEFKSERSAYGYSEPYLRYLYYRLTMAHHRGNVFVSSMNSIQCLLNARKELLLQNTNRSKESLLWVLRILHFIEHYSIFVLDEADEIMDFSIQYSFDTKEPHEKDWDLIDVLIDCFLFLRDKRIFRSQTGEKITIFEIKDPLTPSTAKAFKDTLKTELKNILAKTSKENRVLIVDGLFVNCWEKVRNVGYGASMASPVPYSIPYAMANTPREGSSFGNQMFSIAISVKFYLENEMKTLSEPPLFFREEENIYSTLELYYDYEEVEEIKRQPNSSIVESFKHLRKKIYENDDTLKIFLKKVVIEGIKTSHHQLVSSVVEFILSCSQILAYSSTLYNWKNFEVIPNVDIDVSQSSVIERRIQNSFAFPPLNCYTKDYPEIHNHTGFIHSLGLRIAKDNQFDALMAFILETSTTALFDVGALLKDHSNAKVAQNILASKRYKCVVYYDDKESAIVYQMDIGRIGKDLPVEDQFSFLQTKYNLKNDEIFLYLDQAHCFRTNIDLKNSSAICVITFSTLVYTKSFYKALLRARNLLNGVSADNPPTDTKRPRQQIKIFVSSILNDDQHMLSTLGPNDTEILSLNPILFPDFMPLDKKAALQRVFTSAHLNQFKRDRRERDLLPWQAFFSTALKIFWSPIYSEGNKIPNWDKIVNLSDAKSINELKWIFFSQSMPRHKIVEFFQATQVGKTFFRNFNISFLIPSVADRPALDSETVVQLTKEKEYIEEQEEIDENFEYKNVVPAKCSPFAMSDVKLSNLEVRFTTDFATTAFARLNLNDTYTKYPVFVDIFAGKRLFATMNDVSEKLNDTAHFFFSPALINIYDLEEFDLEDMLHYLAYSGSAVGFMDLLDSSTKVVRDLILRFIASHEPILQQWIYFASKFKKSSSLRLLKLIKSQLKDSTKSNLKNVSIKAKICARKLFLIRVCAKDPKKPLGLDQFDLNLLPKYVKTSQKMPINYILPFLIKLTALFGIFFIFFVACLFYFHDRSISTRLSLRSWG